MVIRNGRLFASQEQANASSSVKGIRRRRPSYVTITIGGISLTEKHYTPNRKSRKLRRKARRIAFQKST